MGLVTRPENPPPEAISPLLQNGNSQMDAVSNFPVTLASTDLRNGDHSDHYVGAKAASECSTFSLARQNSIEARDVVVQVLQSSKENLSAVLQNRVDTERALVAVTAKMEACCASVTALACATKEAALSAELQRLRDQSIADKFAALEAAIKSLSPPPAP